MCVCVCVCVCVYLYIYIISIVDISQLLFRSCCHNGIRQGGSLWPILFSLYLNDLEKYLLNHQSEEGVKPILESHIYIATKLMCLLYASIIKISIWLTT